MPSVIVSALLREIDAAVAEVTPRIRGLEWLANDAMSDETRQYVSGELERLRRARSIYADARASVAQLEAEQFPDLPFTEAPQAVLDDLDRRHEDVGVAVGSFIPKPPASQITLDLGDPSQKE